MDLGAVVQLLADIQGADNAKRKTAETTLNDAKKQHPNEVLAGFTSVLNPQNNTGDVARQQAAVILRRMCAASANPKESPWNLATPATRSAMRTEVLKILGGETG